VLVTGDSYCHVFRDLLIREINISVRDHWRDNQTTEMFADFLRDPELLSGVRVVVWVTSEHGMMRFKTIPSKIAATPSVRKQTGVQSNE